MFKVGEKVVYPAHGVGEIEAIRSHVISGTDKKFYMLRILETDMKIMIPIDNVESVGLRKVIDRTMVSKVYKVLRQKKVETDLRVKGWKRAVLRRTKNARHRAELVGERALDCALSFGRKNNGRAASYLYALILFVSNDKGAEGHLSAFLFWAMS
jgi:hypothetical protein